MKGWIVDGWMDERWIVDGWMDERVDRGWVDG